MAIIITPVYAGLLALIFIGLSIMVSIGRGKYSVDIGHGDDQDLEVRIRRHGNMAEYVPFGLVLMAFAEFQGLSAVWLHVSGLVLIGGRLIHIFGFGDASSATAARIVGSVSTHIAFLVPTGFLLWLAFFA